MSEDKTIDLTPRIMMIISSAVLLLIAAGALLNFYYGTEATLAKRGQEVVATITKLSINPIDSRTGYDKKVDLVFVWNGTEYRIDQPVSQSFLDERNEGEQVTLCVDPENINKVRLSFPTCANKYTS